MKFIEIDQDALKKSFLYRNGFFVRRTTKKIVPGYIRVDGYRHFRFQNKELKYHRAIYVYFNGRLDKEIDHINQNKIDNCIENLRVATRRENSRNRKKSIRNKSGYKGVSFEKSRKLWRATIHDGFKNIMIGRFKSKLEAANAYLDKEAELFGDFSSSDIL